MSTTYCNSFSYCSLFLYFHHQFVFLKLHNAASKHHSPTPDDRVEMQRYDGYGNKLVQEDEPVNLDNNPKRPTRQNLARNCKDNRPNYGSDDIFDDEEIDTFSRRINRRLGTSSSHTIANNQMQKKEDDADRELGNLTILRRLIDMKVVTEETKVSCALGPKENRFGHGEITREGILCCCCAKVISVSEFLHHLSCYKGDKLYQNIIVGATGVTLSTCLVEAWNRHSMPARNGYYHVGKKPRATDDHDDCCMFCADGGELMCCEQCASTYHPRCLGHEDAPQGEWYCPYCQCKYCDRDSSRELLLTCTQCLKKYHWNCYQACDSIPSSLPPSNSISFCGKRCWQVYWNLEGTVGKILPLTTTMGTTLSWVLVRRGDLDAAGEHSDDFHSRVTTNSMVALASKLMDDSFKLIVDRQTGTNTVQSVVYSCGSNLKRTNFSRFYTAIQLNEETIATVASVRIPAPDVAEIPFIATAKQLRNKWFCQYLLLLLESKLAFMGVERIILPSSEDKVMNWRTKFGFTRLDEAMKRRIMTLNTLMFSGTNRLQKDISPEGRLIIDDVKPKLDLNLPPKEEASIYQGAV